MAGRRSVARAVRRGCRGPKWSSTSGWRIACLLDGNRARDPWAVIEDWVASYHKTGDKSLLPRCFELVQRFDGEDGIGRLRQILTAGRIDGGQAKPELLEEAARAGASLCPTCSALVPGRDDAPAERLNISHGRLAAAGFCVEVSERGLVPRLTVEVARANHLSAGRKKVSAGRRAACCCC